MTWILANPLLSLVIAISLALSVLCGVQSIRIKSLKADVLVAEARLERMRVDLDAQSQLVRQWAKQAADARERADELGAEAKIFRGQRDHFAHKLERMKLPANECQALAALVDAHRKQ